MRSFFTDILYNAVVVSVCVGLFSGWRMLSFLKRRGKSRSELFSFNPAFFLNYLEITKKETGKYGIWSKICLFSFVMTFVFLIACLISKHLESVG